VKIALLPYKPNNDPATGEKNRKRTEKIINRLTQYVGNIPINARVITDHYSAGRAIALHFEAQFHVETTIYPWLNPGARKRTNPQQFEHLITSMNTLEVPMLIIVVSATFFGSYAQQIAEILKINTDRNLSTIGSMGILLADPNANEKLKVISVA